MCTCNYYDGTVIVEVAPDEVPTTAPGRAVSTLSTSTFHISWAPLSIAVIAGIVGMRGAVLSDALLLEEDYAWLAPGQRLLVQNAKGFACVELLLLWPTANGRTSWLVVGPGRGDTFEKDFLADGVMARLVIT